MKSYKLNKTLENSTYPIEKELKEINSTIQKRILGTVFTLSTVLFSGIATSFIYEHKLFVCGLSDWLNKHNCNISLEVLFFIFLCIIYAGGLIGSGVNYLKNRYKEKPKNMKKKPYGRRVLSEKFHKSIINDIVVGLSFLDKTSEEGKLETEIKNMYLFEAAYYFSQAEMQIELMELFDDKKEVYNKEFIDEVGYETLLTTLLVFQNGVKNVMNKMPKAEEKIMEYEKLEKIYENLKIHINILKGKKYKENKSWFKNS